MTRQISETKNENGDIVRTWRSGRFFIRHFVAHRGGSLYLGEMMIKNLDTCKQLFFQANSPRPSIGYIESLIEKHSEKLK